MRKVLITGGAGFVGRRFVKRFLDSGDLVYAVDSVVSGTGGIHPDKGWPLFDPRDYHNFRFFHQDCRDWFRNSTECDFDYAIHLAAVVGGRMMIEHNPLAVAQDLAIDADYWDWAVRTKPRKTVCFSSSAAYPIKYQRHDSYQLLKEEMIQIGGDIGMPDMSYGWAKLTCEYLARLAHEKYGLKSVVYRPFSGYGEDQDMTYPFPSICLRALKNKNKERITVWGSGRQMRDFIYIEDCVDGVIKTMDIIDDGDALNLSTGKFTSFIDFARLAAHIVGYEPMVEGTTDKPEGVFARAGDTAKLKALGVEPKICLEKGMEKVLKYLEANG